MDEEEPIDLRSMSILQRVQSSGDEVYLPDLQVIPGKVEFTYLPINCQSALLLPVNDDDLDGMAIIVGTNQVINHILYTMHYTLYTFSPDLSRSKMIAIELYSLRSLQRLYHKALSFYSS